MKFRQGLFTTGSFRWYAIELRLPMGDVVMDDRDVKL